MSEKVLVTGGGGYVGSVLVPMLLERGYVVRVLDNFIFRQESFFRNLVKDYGDKVEILKGDVRDRNVLSKALDNVEFIIHLAALVGELAFRKNLVFGKETNTDSTYLLNSLRSKNQFLIFTSTTSIYGENLGICDETSSVNPRMEYALSKAEAEKRILNSEKGNFIILRPATAYGLSPRIRLDLLPNEFVYKAIFDKKLLIYEPNKRRTFVNVYDLASAIFFLLDNFIKMKDEVFNIGSEELNMTKMEVALVVKKILDYELVLVDDVKDPDQRDFEVSYKKLRSFGFNVKINLENGLRDLAEVLKNKTDKYIFGVNYLLKFD